MWGLAALTCLSFADPSLADGVLRDGFETPGVGWTEEVGDVRRTVQVHERTSSSVHSGKQSEHIGISADRGTHLFYSYTIGRAPLVENPHISLWVKADRPGIQLLARVVFPHERDPSSRQLLTTLLAGEEYKEPGTWQRLELPRPDLAVQRQARLLRASLNRNIDIQEAYVDRLLLNVYGGPGDTNVFVDDLSVSPVLSDAAGSLGAQLGGLLEDPGPSIEVSQDQLLVASQPRLLRAVRAPRVLPQTLKKFGFNVLVVEWPLDLAWIEQGVTARLWLQPQLPSTSGGLPPHRLSQLVGEFPLQESVLCWHLGAGLDRVAFSVATELLEQLRNLAPRRPIAGDVTGHFRAYSRHLDMVSVRRRPIGTAMELRHYRDWLAQRRYLARPGTYFFTWVQALAKPVQTADGLIDAGPAPEQIRLMTYAALAAGYRGLGFWADETLGKEGLGRQRLLEMGLLNLELQLLEPYLASAGSVGRLNVQFPSGGRGIEKQSSRSGRVWPAGLARRRGARLGSTARHKGEVQAAVVRSDGGLVLIPVWYGRNGQFVAGQFAANNINVVIPGIPEAAQAWHVTPASIQLLERKRVAGGTQLLLPMIDLTGMVVLTSNTREVQQLKKAVELSSRWAASWTAELATLKLQTVKDITDKLAELGRRQPDGAELIRTAKQSLVASRTALTQGGYDVAYAEGQRALRALRILGRAHWDDAAKDLSRPQASPYAVSLATLPEHWRLMNRLLGAEYGENLLPSGSFDFDDAQPMLASWLRNPDPTGNLELKVTLSSRQVRFGSRSLHLRARLTRGEQVPAALDAAMPALVSAPIPVREGDLVRIRFWLRVPTSVQGNLDGFVIYDSIGGRDLAITQSEPQEWKQFTLYRHVERSGSLTITMGLAGVGDAFVDALHVQRVVRSPSLATQQSTPQAR